MTPITKGRVVFLSALALLCLTGIASYLSFVSLRESERWVSHTQEVRAAVGDVESAISEASRLRTAFLISGDPAQLNAYRATVPRISERMQRLEELIGDNETQGQQSKKLESITTARVQTWEELIVQKQQGRPIDAAQLLQQNLDFSTRSTAVAEEIRAEEIRLLEQRVQVAYRRFGRSRAIVTLSFLLAILLLYVHYRLLAAELRARVRAELAARSAYLHESELRQGEERFRLFIDAVRDYALFMLDVEGRISSWNPGAQRMKGYEASQILGKHFSCFYPPGDIQSRKPWRELEQATKEGRIEDEGWRVRKDGSMFWANVIITALRDDLGKLVGFAKITRDFTERMLAQKALHQRNLELANEVAERTAAEQRLVTSENSLRKLSFHLLRTQDEERKRIGRDLHDSLGQYLAALKMHLDSIQMHGGAMLQNGGGEEIEKCIRLAEDSLREMRTISYLLYPPMLEEMGLKSAIRWYIEGFSKRSKIETSFEVDPGFERLAPDAELALFRILQESLTNVHRHSGSASAHVRLFTAHGKAVLEIQDKGRGFPTRLLEQVGEDWLGSAGVGLRGMSERMRQFGGCLEVSSAPYGTVVTASMPAETLDEKVIKSA